MSRAPPSPWPSVRALAPVRPPHYPALPAGGIILQQVLTVAFQICPLAGGDSPGPSLSICIFPGCEVECMGLHCIACVCKTGGNIPGFLDSEARGTLPQPGIDYILGVKGSEQARGQESCLCQLFRAPGIILLLQPRLLWVDVCELPLVLSVSEIIVSIIFSNLNIIITG